MALMTDFIRSTRYGLAALAAVTYTASMLCVSQASAQAATGVPTGGFISFSLAPGQSSAPITPPLDVPVLVMGSTTTANNRGVAQVVMEHQSASFLQWVGLNSDPTASVTASYSGTPGTQILQIDFHEFVYLVVSGTDSFVVTNSSTTDTETGYVSWTYLSNSTAGNTILGNNALSVITTGADNTAVGAESMPKDTTGTGNTAVGWDTLSDNTTGSYNTGLGYRAFAANVAGSYTTAVGAYSLSVNTTGGYDTGFGAYSLSTNTTGTGNTAFGYAGLRSNTTGNNNIGFGYQTMYSNQTGSNNVALGYQAAYYVTNGSNNVEISNTGTTQDEDLIRIGTTGTHKATYVAGIYGTSVTGGEAVYVNSAGQLGYQPSASRFKTDVESMPELTAKIQQLHPVTFHYKTDANKVLQFGLIAEEVDKVYPELVIRDDSGVIQGVRYEELAPMLLSVVQKQQNTLQTEQATMNTLSAQNAAQSVEISELKQQVLAQADQLKSTQGQVAKLNALETELHAMLAKVRDGALVAKR
jgi:hypothetical protein